MRLFLAVALILLFLWLHKTQTTESLHGKPCEAASVSKAVVSFLVSPLSLYSWLSSVLVRLILSAPALFLSCLHHSLLLFLAGPWCFFTVCASLLLTCLHVAVYFLHLALVVGAVAILTLARHKMADGDATSETPQMKLLKLRMFGGRATK